MALMNKFINILWIAIYVSYGGLRGKSMIKCGHRQHSRKLGFYFFMFLKLEESLKIGGYE